MSTEPEFSLSPPAAPSALPTRIYFGGVPYKILEPKGPLPPLVGTVKLIWNWLMPLTGRIAKNVMFALLPGADTTNTATLQAVGNNVMSSVVTALVPGVISNSWQLSSVTVRDNGGTSTNQAISTHAAVTGGSGNPSLAPNVAVCISWQTNITARGGRSRQYLPGAPNTAQATVGDSLMSTTYATSLENAANTFLTTFNAMTTGLPSGITQAIGTLTHYHKYTILTTPIWRPFNSAKVHERLDSQRRRNGKEALFPVQ